MRRIITSLIAILAVTNIEAQQAPKLVVYITVDQLRGDYIEYFYNTFGEGGFKRLLNQGKVYNNVKFEFSNIDQATAFATLFTGSNPCYNGISANEKYDFDKERYVSILNDPEYIGNYTRANFSPKALLASTIGDELKIASKGKSDIYTIAPNPESAILSAGNAANGAFWMDDYNGTWATTTFYKGVPWYVDNYNNGLDALPARLSVMTWESELPMEKLNAFPYTQDIAPFKHTFVKNTADCYLNIKTSPVINSEITRLASRFFEYGGLGTRSCPDMLAITYYAGNYRNKMSNEYTQEIQDTYYRLDKEIEQLLNNIDNKVGIRNSLVILSGTGYHKSEEELPKDLTLSGGEFNPKRFVALLNMYLMAIYGQQNWVKGYYNDQIYLDRKAIENARIDLADVQNKAAEFIREFKGIQYATTDNTLRTGEWNERTSDLRNGTHYTGRGDIIIELQPGWSVVDENVKTKKIVRNNAVITPLIFLGNGIKPEHIYREVKATEIAPTITHVLRIRPPNACRDLPLFEFTNKK